MLKRTIWSFIYIKNNLYIKVKIYKVYILNDIILLLKLDKYDLKEKGLKKK